MAMPRPANGARSREQLAGPRPGLVRPCRSRAGSGRSSACAPPPRATCTGSRLPAGRATAAIAFSVSNWPLKVSTNSTTALPAANDSSRAPGERRASAPAPERVAAPGRKRAARAKAEQALAEPAQPRKPVAQVRAATACGSACAPGPAGRDQRSRADHPCRALRSARGTRPSSAPCRRRSGIRAGSPCSRRKAPSLRAPRRSPAADGVGARAGRTAPAAACWRGRASGAARRASRESSGTWCRRRTCGSGRCCCTSPRPWRSRRLGSPPLPGAVVASVTGIVLHVPRRPVEHRLQRDRDGRRSAARSGTARRRPSSAGRRSGRG